MSDQSNSDPVTLSSILTKIDQDDSVPKVLSAKNSMVLPCKITQSLNDIVQQHVVEAGRTADETVARTRALKKYCPDDCKRISTEIIKNLFDLADREVIANLLMGNEG